MYVSACVRVCACVRACWLHDAYFVHITTNGFEMTYLTAATRSA